MPTESQSIFASLTPNDWGIIFTMLGVAFAAVLAGIGSAIGVGKAGQAAAGVVAEQPDRFGNCMVLQLLPGSQGIYGFAVAILILIFSGVLGGDTSALTLEKGLSYFAASLPSRLAAFFPRCIRRRLRSAASTCSQSARTASVTR